MKTAKPVTLGDLTAFFALLFSVFKRDQVWVVRFKTGQEPKLYPMARTAAQSLEGNYNPKAQEHIFVLDPQPAMRTWADEVQTHHISLDPHAVLDAALERGEDATGRAEKTASVEPVKAAPKRGREFLTAVDFKDQPKKLEIWVGSNLMGHVIQGSNPEAYTAFIGKVKVHTLAPLGVAVVKLLKAAGFSLEEVKDIDGLILPDGSIVALEVTQPALVEAVTVTLPNGAVVPVLERPEPSIEKETQIAEVGDLQPITPAHADVLIKSEMLLLELVYADPDLQTRGGIDPEIVSEYAMKLERGVEFAPVEVYLDDGHYYLVDGFHRHAAHAKLGREWIRATVTQGDKRAAFLAALQSNQQHGLRRSNANKRHAIKLMLLDEELCNWSDRRIADFLDVDGKTVSRERENLEREDAIKTSSTRTSATGANVPAKREPVKPAPADPVLNFGPQSEPKASLEHGSTRDDQRRVFKTVELKQQKENDRKFAFMGLDEPKAKKSHSISRSPEITEKHYVDFTYHFDEPKHSHGGPLQAQSWTGAVIEYLGTLGIVDPNLEITFVSADGEPMDVPSLPARVDSSTNNAAPIVSPEPVSTGSENPMPGVLEHLTRTLEALTEMKAACSPRDVFDALEADHGLANLYRDLYWAAMRVTTDMSDALEREGLTVT